MSAAAEQVAVMDDRNGRPTFGSLLSAEWLRLRSRRLVKVVLVLALVVFALVVGGTFVRTSVPSGAELAAAQQQADKLDAACVQSVTADKSLPPGTDPTQYCGKSDPTVYLAKPPFDFAASYKGGRIGVAVLIAALLFLIGASAGGAEWSARTMPALLYWEPRRLRVMGAKVLVLAAFGVVVSLAFQALWLVSALLLRATRGLSPAPPFPHHLWSDTAGVVGRGLLLAVLVSVGAFALANLTRSTGAALGVAFVYFAVAENVVQAVAPKLARWTLVNNVGGFLVPGGIDVQSGVKPPPYPVDAGAGSAVPEFIHLSNVRGGLVLTTVVVVVLLVATILFQRRDIS